MNFDWQNVVANDGLGLAGAGMGIVFFALVLICLYIAVLPKILAWVNLWLPEMVEASHAAPAPSESEDSLLATAAAAAMDLHTRTGGRAA